MGAIDPADLAGLLCFVTPLELMSPIDAGVCQGQTIYITGWGVTCTTDAIMLQVATSSLSSIIGEMDGRKGAILHPGGGCGSACVPGISNRDSGAPIIVDGPNNSLIVVGINRSAVNAIIAVRHQFFTDPNSEYYLCEPCGSLACYDVMNTHNEPTPDGLQTCHDLVALASLGTPRSVNCWCPGDLNGNGCSGDAFDINTSGCASFLTCNPNQWCHGDANLDGRVDSDDHDYLVAILAANGPMDCGGCTACPAKSRWCCGDLNCDYMINDDDLEIVDALLTQFPSGYDCSPTSPGCDGNGACP